MRRIQYRLRKLPKRLKKKKEMSAPSSEHSGDLKTIPLKQGIEALVALVCWILLYGVGLTAESIEQRIMLAPHTMEKQLGENGKSLVADVKSLLKKIEEDPKEKNSYPKVRAFFQTLLVYTPTNMAILTLLAGFMGGCVSNLKYSMMSDKKRKELTDEQDAILSENPLTATMRGFVIYLCLVAGLYVALDDPFKDSTPGQYARLAGSMSFVAFVVGFDPNRLKAWLRLADDKNPTGGSATTNKQ